eukprot:GCRY01000864.1.p1 GENE.GCRY01000864.1~~GCRY01000864.1.p1  ORF type:complete len:735 (-),score=207.88 GCRY01000864.1:181-2325(-)
MKMPLKYPEIEATDFHEELHGVTVADPYRWMEDAKNEKVQEWVRKQADLTNQFIEEHCPKRDELQKEIEEIYGFPQYSVPVVRGERVFLLYDDGTQNQMAIYLRHGFNGTSELLIDPNTWSEDGSVIMKSPNVSRCGKLISYKKSVRGSDWCSIHVFNVDTRVELPDVLDWVKFSSVSITYDETGLFYARYPVPEECQGKRMSQIEAIGEITASNVYQKVYYHKFGTSQDDDVLVLEDPVHPGYSFSFEWTDCYRYLLVSITKSCDHEHMLAYMDLQGFNNGGSLADAKLVFVAHNFDAVYNYIHNAGTLFYFVTNHNGATRSKVVTLDIATMQWATYIPETKHVLENVRYVSADPGYMILSYFDDVKSRVSLHDFATGRFLRNIALPCVGRASVTTNPLHPYIFISFVSFFFPGRITVIDSRTFEEQVFSNVEVGGLNPDDYSAQQVFFPSKDGTKIPMFILQKKDTPQDGSAPLLLCGYGGFNISVRPYFSISSYAALKLMSFSVAVVNLRGGGEYGDSWHDAGRKHLKQNCFDDFIAAAEYLVAEKYTHSDRLAILGGSNGGLLTAAVSLQRPELFRCTFTQVGVLDMLRFHKFTIGHHWTSDYGNPDDAEDFATLIKYSPYHNIREELRDKLPFFMVMTAASDDRVSPAPHSFKFLARLQAVCGSAAAPILGRIETKSGHSSMTRKMIIAEIVDRLLFMKYACVDSHTQQ